MVTFHFSTIDLENLTKEDFEKLLAAENLVRFKPGERYLAFKKRLDPSGNELWSVNVVVGDDEETFVEDTILFKAYPRIGDAG